MTVPSTLSQAEMARFLKVVQDSLAVSRHQELFNWLHDDIQHFIPHDILLAAWGDFSLGLIHVDIVSYFSGVRTAEVNKALLMPALQDIFQRWEASDRNAFLLSPGEDNSLLDLRNLGGGFGAALALMRSAMAHGMKDQRGRHDCLYVLLSANREAKNEALSAFGLLLPYMDASLRQIEHLAAQYPDLPEIQDVEEHSHGPGGGNPGDAIPEHLSEREIEIMQWVCQGKTNGEIAQILDISFFTVKNHLQRIFRKLDVLNRAQAVSKTRNWFENSPR